MGFTAPASSVSALAAAIGAAVSSTPSIVSTYGDGSDGNVTISGTVTLTQDMDYATLTVNAGAILKTAGWKVRCSVALNNNGSITNNGPAGAGLEAGAPTGSLGGGGKGGRYDLAPYDIDGKPPIAATLIGGSGGASDGTSGAPRIGTGIGGVGATGTALVGAITLNNLATATMSGGAGGGASGITAHLVGTGGGGGGAVAIFAVALNNNGTISANGGWDGSAYNGGGGGGTVLLVSTTRTGAVALVTPGTGWAFGRAGTIIELTL